MEQDILALAHDLRLPLQVILSCAQMIGETLPGDSPAGAYVDMLRESVDSMERLLTGALERRGGSVRERRAGTADTAACVRAQCRRWRPRAEAAGVRLSWSGNVDSLIAALDGDALSRILMNLLANALRFTPAGGAVRVTLTALGDFAELSVADDGCGIPPERLDRIFLPGETDGGHGYGLPIARELARSMGGELSAQAGPGGACFILRLPIHAAGAG